MQDINSNKIFIKYYQKTNDVSIKNIEDGLNTVSNISANLDENKNNISSNLEKIDASKNNISSNLVKINNISSSKSINGNILKKCLFMIWNFIKN